jgi:hypothetical protein
VVGSLCSACERTNLASSRSGPFGGAARLVVGTNCNGRIGCLRPRATGETALVVVPLGARFQKIGTDFAGVNGWNVAVHALGLATFFRAMAMRSRTKPAKRSR